MAVVEQFDTWDINNASIQFISGGTQAPGTKFGCIGTMTSEPETVVLSKRCGRTTIREKTVTTKLNVTVSAHVEVQVLRDYFGLTNEDLKAGVYSYGSDSLGKDFVFTADVIDSFEDNTKLIAFPNASNSGGFTINIDTSQEELAMLEISFSAVADVANQFYYEAIVAELDDPTIAETWHTNFTRDLVAAVETP